MMGKEKFGEYITKSCGYITIAAAIVLLICLVGGSYFYEFSVQNQNSVCLPWEAEWQTREVSEEEIHFLIQEGVELEGRAIQSASAKLPHDAKEHMYLLTMIVYSDAWVYVGNEPFSKEELRYVFYPEQESAWGKTGYSARRSIPLYDRDQNGYITVLQVADSAENFIHKKDIVYGDKYGLLLDYIKHNYATFLSNMGLLVLSTISLMVVLGACILLRKIVPILYLIIGIFNLALWTVTNSFVMDFTYQNWHILHDLLYLSDCLVPIAFMLYLNSVQKRRYKLVYYICLSVYTPIWCIGILLYIFNVCSLHDFFMHTIGLYLIQILAILITILVDVIRRRAKDYRYVLMGFVMIAICGFIQIVMYIINSTQMTMPFLSIGVILLLLTCFLEGAQEILGTYVERAAALSASKAKSDVLARMSHEIRTPINAIVGMNEMVLRSTKEESSREYSTDIRRATNNLLEIVNDILDFSKLESGKMELVCEEYDLGLLLKDITRMFRYRAEDKKLEFQTNIDTELPKELYGDSVKVRQIIVNILSNAVKYTNRGSIKLEVSGKVKEDVCIVHVAVRDTGIGIKPENMTKLFEEYRRIEEQANRGVVGTGLGISIICRFLEMMESKLQVDSVYGEGSVFYFDLEQRIVNPAPMGDLEVQGRDEKVYQKRFVAPQAQILVVDDNPMNLKVFMNLLEDSQIQIDAVESGEEGLECIKKKAYDVIFLDHMMPGMNGMEMLHRLKKMEDSMCPDAPVIVLTANAISGSREFYLEAGFDDFISKPFNPEDLEDRILERIPKEYVQWMEGAAEQTEEKETERIFSQKAGIETVEGLFWEAGRNHFKKDKDYIDTLKGLCLTMGYESDKLRNRYEEIDGLSGEVTEVFRQYRVQVHSMKGTANLVGAMILGAQAKSLELAAQQENREYLLANTQEFLDAWDELKAAVSRIFEENTEEKENGADQEAMIAELESLRVALEAMDVDGADAIMKKLNGYVYSEDMEIQIKELATQVYDLEEEKAGKIIDELVNCLQ